MRLILIAIVVALSLACVSAKRDKLKTYQEFIRMSGKKHAPHEVAKRMNNVHETMLAVDKFTKESKSKNYTFKVGMTTTCDLDRNEKKKLCGLISHSNHTKTTHQIQKRDLTCTSLPTNVDLRPDFLKIRNQEQCGSCWAFAAVGVAEYLLKKQISLSPQHLVDCDYQQSACNGGITYYAAQFMINNGVATETSYPYTGEQGYCKNNINLGIQPNKLKDLALISTNVENSMMCALSKGNPSIMHIAVEDESPFYNYKTGVYNKPTNIDPNHAVIVVGYGTNSDGTKYWIIRNSWDTTWGINGYGLVQRGTNMCGVERYAVTFNY